MNYNSSYLDNKNFINNELICILNSYNISYDNFINCGNSFLEKISFDFIYSSAQIEGNTYNKLDTLSLLEDGITMGGKKYTDAKMIINLKNAIDYIINNDLQININTLYNLHEIVSDELVQKVNCGRMRNLNISGITGTSYLPLPFGEKLHEELKYLFSIYNKIDNPFIKAIYLHNNLCYLQFFEDCNKRTARLMQFLSFKNSNIMPLVLINDDKEIYKEYRNSMINYYESGSYEKYLDFFMKNYKIELELFRNIEENNKQKNIKIRRK